MMMAVIILVTSAAATTFTGPRKFLVLDGDNLKPYTLNFIKILPFHICTDLPQYLCNNLQLYLCIHLLLSNPKPDTLSDFIFRDLITRSCQTKRKIINLIYFPDLNY